MRGRPVNYLIKLLIFSPEKQAILTSVNSHQVKLPTLTTTISHLALTQHINEHITTTYGIETAVLKCARSCQNERAYVLEHLSGNLSSFTPVNWLPISKEQSFSCLNERDNRLLQGWVSEKEDIPWFRIGWRQNIEELLVDRLQERVWKIEQIRSWERSSLLRLYIEKETYILKIVPTIFQHEPTLCSYLKKKFPSYVPEVILVEPTYNAFIMKEVNGSLLGLTDNVIYWRKALINLGKIQVGILHDVEQLHCPNRPVDKIIIEYLESTLEKLLENKFITKEIFQTLTENLPEVMNIVDKIKRSSIPISIDHGDFFGGNIILEDEETIVYDWSDSSLTHPFFSAVVFLQEVEEFFSKEEADSLLVDYLSLWSNYATTEQLSDEFELVKYIAPIFGLTVYESLIFPTFRDNWDREIVVQGYINSWLKNIK